MTLVDIILPPVGLSDMRKSLNSFLHEPVDRHCTAFSTDCPDGFLFDKTSKSISSALGRYPPTDPHFRTVHSLKPLLHDIA